MDQGRMEKFQKAYRRMFSSYLDILYEKAWKEEEARWRDVRPCLRGDDWRPRVPPKFVPLSQQLRETEERWARAERFARTADIFERAFARDVAAQEAADDLAAQAAIVCERYETKFAITSQRPSHGMRRGSGRGGSAAFSSRQ